MMHPRSARLLVVEDSPDFLLLIREAFVNRPGAHQWNVSVATDGEQALEMILGSAEPPVDIILLDWNLPKVSGSEVLQRVKAHPELRKIPVLVFSSSDSENDVHEAYGYYANGYITKPTDLDLLFKIAEAVENFWVATAELTSRSPGRRHAAYAR